jgi:hypothetical protein
VLVRALGLLLLLDRGDDAPRSTAGADDILIGNRKKVALVDGELTTQLCMGQYLFDDVDEKHASGMRTLRGNRTLATSCSHVSFRCNYS